MKRMRKAGITDPVTGELVPFPYMPRVAELPPGWRWFSTAEKVEHLLGMSLDRAAEILAWPLAELDPLQLSLRMQVWRIVFMIASRRCSMARKPAKLTASAIGSVFSQSSRATCAQQMVARRHVRGGPGAWGRGSKLGLARISHTGLVFGRR
jgi:hypothetical protein